MTTATLAIIILVAILAQIAILALAGFYRSRRQYRDQSVKKSESVTAPQAAAPSAKEPSTPGPAWEGFREFVVQRRVFENKKRSVCSFYLASVDGQPLPTFRPGQYLTFNLQIEDPITHQSRKVVRCYSLSDHHHTSCYRVTIKRVSAPLDHPDAPPGLSSNFFHDQVQEGDRLMIKAPSGHFHLMEEEPLPMVLIAGGIGITPMLSILNSLLERGVSREVWLYYGIRHGSEHIMKEHLQAIARAHSNFHLHVCYSAPDEEDVKGEDYQHDERVSLPLLRSTLKLKRYQFYVCGPKPMMESIVTGLEEWGVNADDIYYESFGPATLIKHKRPAVERDARSATVTFGKSGKSVAWDPSVDSLLTFAEINGIAVESGCRAGSCGSCQTALNTGEVEYTQQPDSHIEPDHCLLCISVPKGDLTLEV